MAITSSNFGRTKLTADDAKKFERQVKYGRTNAAAVTTVREGRAMAASFFKSSPAPADQRAR